MEKHFNEESYLFEPLLIEGRFGDYHLEKNMKTVLGIFSRTDLVIEEDVIEFFEEIRTILEKAKEKITNIDYFISDISEAKFNSEIIDYYGEYLAEVFYEYKAKGLVRFSPSLNHTRWELAAFFGEVPSVSTNSLKNAVSLIKGKIKVDAK
jgi:hypothetical protein